MTEARVIRFTTSVFDVAKERRNPINPIADESLLLWLRERARQRFEVSEPDAEDWGWYASVVCNGRRYMLGASASDEEDGAREWILQIVKHRSFVEKLFGREKMVAADDCATFFQTLLADEPSFKGVSVDP